MNKKENIDIKNNKLDVYDSKKVNYVFKDWFNRFHSLQDDVIALLNTYFSLVQNDTKQLEEVNFLPFIQKKKDLQSIQKVLRFQPDYRFNKYETEKSQTASAVYKLFYK